MASANVSNNLQNPTKSINETNVQSATTQKKRNFEMSNNRHGMSVETEQFPETTADMTKGPFEI